MTKKQLEAEIERLNRLLDYATDGTYIVTLDDDSRGNLGRAWRFHVGDEVIVSEGECQCLASSEPEFAEYLRQKEATSNTSRSEGQSLGASNTSGRGR
jgi:hypothetical protein